MSDVLRSPKKRRASATPDDAAAAVEHMHQVGGDGGEVNAVPVGTFSSQLWRDVEPSFGKILNHAFPVGLADGTLEESSFLYFLIQNFLLLKDYGRGLSLAAAKAGLIERVLLLSGPLRSIQELQVFHEELLKKWHVDEELLESAQQTPNCLLATSFLLRLAYDRPFFESLAAFLPVLWINMAVARHLLHVRKPSIREDYARFLEVYGSLSLGESLADMVGLLDEVAIEVSEEDRLVMRRHFALSSKIVYMQYDMGHTEQRWPI